MRIASLALSPYGHLTHARVDLPAAAGGPGLHVLSGRNGAGKSTSLRALDGALFGIPRRTRDAHTHPGPALMIALSLERADGQILRVERRKRDGQSLFAPDGAPVDEAVLRDALGGLPPEEFRAMFLLDCAKLEEGSADLLEGRGLLGEALFGAALGFGRVHKVLAELDAEADALWVKGGARTLNRHLKVLGDARKDKRHGRLDPDQWARLRRELEETEEQLVTVQEALVELGRRIGRTARHERCLAPLAGRRGLLERLDELPRPPKLPVSFPADVRTARADLDEADRIIAHTRDELERVDGELKANPDPGPIVDREDAVNALYQRAGESAKASKDLPRREAELAARRYDVQRLVARAHRAEHAPGIAALRVCDADRARLDELATQHAALGQARQDAANAVTCLTRRAATHNASGPAMPALSEASQAALGEAIEAARDDGDLDTAARNARHAASGHREAAEHACATLPGWGGDVDRLERLQVPSAATLQRFTQGHAELDRAAERLRDRAADLEARAVSLQHDDDVLAAGPNAPTRAQVTAARRQRDHALDALIAEPAHHDRGAAVHDGVRTADGLADARADHAGAAAARERLERDRVALRAAREQLTAARNAHAASTGEFATRWAAAWPGLLEGPRAPEEMREWLASRSEILAAARAARADDAEAAGMEQVIEQHRSALSDVLGGLTDPVQEPGSLSTTLRLARAAFAAATAARNAGEQHEHERARLADELAVARDRVEATETGLTEWRTAWRPITEALALPLDATPAQARAQLAVIDALLAASDNEAALDRRVEALRKDEENFEVDARALALELAPDLADAEPLAVADALHARAAKARGARAARMQLEPRWRELAQQAAAATRAHEGANERLQALAERAGVTADALEDLCTVIDDRVELVDDLDRISAEIEAAGAAGVAQLAEELVDATPEGLAALRAADEGEAQDLEERRSGLERAAGALREKLDSGGSDDAALAAEREAHARAAVVDGLEHYAELRFAAAALRAAIERHRRQHQGPLLTRASELFARLSGGKMTGLTVVTTERQPYIMGVLPDSREVSVQGLSAGQRHQLFLALRLASLERHFNHSEPMPLVLDDLLVQLDDVSARAALEILAELARETQILFFTHHDHLVMMAREAVPSDLLIEGEVGEEMPRALRAA